MSVKHFAVVVASVAALHAQSTSKSESSIVQKVEQGDTVVEIRNSGFELAGNLVLRKTIQSREVVGDKGLESEVALAAWPLGNDLAKKPLYEVKAKGTDARTRNGEIWIVEDATDPDVPVWSVYTLATGRRLFRSHVHPLEFGVSRADGTLRYAGLEVPPDDAEDSRPRAKNVAAVLSYSAADRVIREAILTCDDPSRATELRSYFDEERTLEVGDRASGRFLRIAFHGAYPNRADEQVITIPVGKSGLDLAHAVTPAGVRVSVWQR